MSNSRIAWRTEASPSTMPRAPPGETVRPPARPMLTRPGSANRRACQRGPATSAPHHDEALAGIAHRVVHGARRRAVGLALQVGQHHLAPAEPDEGRVADLDLEGLA